MGEQGSFHSFRRPWLHTAVFYFIECYCQPNEIFLLTASQVLPISQELKLTLSSDLQIHIQAGELFRLYPVYYISPQSGFVYNYAANRKLNRTESDTLYLSILTPEAGSGCA